MFLLAGCAAAKPATMGRDRFSDYLRGNIGSPQIPEIEGRLRLNAPVDVRWPGFTDPMWWFIYRIDGYQVELAANGEHPEGWPHRPDVHDRNQFWFTGYWYVRPLSREELHTPTRAQKTIDILRMRGGSAKCRYSEYLSALDRTTRLRVSEIEAELGLFSPVNAAVPAFINPMWWFFYEADGYVIVLTGEATEDIRGGDVEAMEAREKFVFAGYWRVFPMPSAEEE